MTDLIVFCLVCCVVFLGIWLREVKEDIKNCKSAINGLCVTLPALMEIDKPMVSFMIKNKEDICEMFSNISSQLKALHEEIEGTGEKIDAEIVTKVMLGEFGRYYSNAIDSLKQDTENINQICLYIKGIELAVKKVKDSIA